MESSGGADVSRLSTHCRFGGRCVACDTLYTRHQVLHGSNTRLYECPSDTELRRQWALLCGVDPADKRMRLRVCSKHFRREQQHTMRCRLMGGITSRDGRSCPCTLQEGAVPSIDLPDSSDKVKTLLQRAERAEKQKNRIVVENLLKQRSVPQSERLLAALCEVEEDYEIVSGPAEENEAYVFSDSDNEAASAEAGMEAVDDKSLLELEEPAVQLTELCRVCSAVAAGREGTLHVFQEQGLACRLRHKINLCLPIQVSETDTLPLLVCASCLVALETSYSLTQTCRQADRDLQFMQAEQHKLFEPTETISPASSSTLDNPPHIHAEPPAAVQKTQPSTARHVLVLATAPRPGATSPAIIKTIPLTMHNNALNISRITVTSPQNFSTSSTAPRKTSFARNTTISLTPSQKTATTSATHRKTNIPLKTPPKYVYSPRKSASPSRTSFEILSPQTVNSNIPEISPPPHAFSESMEEDKNPEADRENRVHSPIPLPELECTICKSYFSAYPNYSFHMRKYHGTYLCRACPDFVARSMEELEKHRQEKKKSAVSLRVVKKIHSCSKCGLTFKQRNKLSWHMNKHKEISDYVCGFCGKQFYDPHFFQMHQDIHLPRQHQCKVCSQRFAFKKNMLAHVKTVHGKKWMWKCTICQMEYDSEAKIKEHVIQSHRTEQADIPELSSHYLKISPFQCAHCEKYFGTRLHILQHLKYKHRIVDGNKLSTKNIPSVKTKTQFMCEICGKGFRQKATLKIHYNVHKEVKDFKCSLCEKSYCTKSGLQNHAISHTGEKPFLCDACPARFASKHCLQLHKKTHSDERPHACKYCGKTFKRKGYLVVHERVHTNDRPILCQICGKGYKQHADRNRHILSKHKK